MSDDPECPECGTQISAEPTRVSEEEISAYNCPNPSCDWANPDRVSVYMPPSSAPVQVLQ
jgi:hypothetical protein